MYNQKQMKRKALPSQVLSHCPPGYGGVERVAHELANSWNTRVYHMQEAAKNKALGIKISYPLKLLPSFSIGRYYLPSASNSLLDFLWDESNVHFHLPSPGALCLLVLFSVTRSRSRSYSLHWHAILSETDTNLFIRLIIRATNRVSLYFARRASIVVVTSPILRTSLTQRGVDGKKITVLPCSLGNNYEEQLLDIHRTIREFDLGLLRVLFIGRLDSYKRLDWLIDSLRIANVPWHLDVVGDGPRREYLQKYSKRDPVVFHGIINESEKLNLLRGANIFCLISDKCNEAFGIVQLEAMASGIPSLALNLRDSGMYWVSKTSSLPWSGLLADLPNALSALYLSPALFKRCSEEARARYLQLFSSATWHEECFELTSNLLSK